MAAKIERPVPRLPGPKRVPAPHTPCAVAAVGTHMCRMPAPLPRRATRWRVGRAGSAIPLPTTAPPRLHRAYPRRSHPLPHPLAPVAAGSAHDPPLPPCFWLQGTLYALPASRVLPWRPDEAGAVVHLAARRPPPPPPLLSLRIPAGTAPQSSCRLPSRRGRPWCPWWRLRLGAWGWQWPPAARLRSSRLHLCQRGRSPFPRAGRQDGWRPPPPGGRPRRGGGRRPPPPPAPPRPPWRLWPWRRASR